MILLSLNRSDALEMMGDLRERIRQETINLHNPESEIWDEYEGMKRREIIFTELKNMSLGEKYIKRTCEDPIHNPNRTSSPQNEHRRRRKNRSRSSSTHLLPPIAPSTQKKGKEGVIG